VIFRLHQLQVMQTGAEVVVLDRQRLRRVQLHE
jgi:hypothetical protein